MVVIIYDTIQLSSNIWHPFHQTYCRCSKQEHYCSHHHKYVFLGFDFRFYNRVALNDKSGNAILTVISLRLSVILMQKPNIPVMISLPPQSDFYD